MQPLTSPQRILLGAAAERSNHSIYPVPTSVAPGRIMWSVRELLADRLIEERETAEQSAVVHQFGDLHIGFFVTPAGLAAIARA